VRKLGFFNLHTGEKLSVPYWENGRYLQDALGEINYVLRDHRANAVRAIDTALLDLLARLQQAMGNPRAFEVISGYRAPDTNAMLRARSGGVAKGSMHLQGKAIDVRLPGWKDARLQWAVGATPIVAANLEPAGAVPDALPRILTLDVGALPAGTSLRLLAPERRDLQAGTWCVEVPFRRAGAGWAPAAIELEATAPGGAAPLVELGTRESPGTARVDLRPEDASSPLRVRVRVPAPPKGAAGR